METSEKAQNPLPVPEHVGHKILTIAELSAKAERRAGRHQLVIERATEAVGRPATAYGLAFVIMAYLVVNGLGAHLGFRPFDPPPFSYLQVVACIAALLMSVAILTTQNRVAKLSAQRAQLDLQVNLIAEEKVAKLIALVEELRRDLPSVRNREDPLAEAMTEAVDLHAVAGGLETIQEGGDPEAILPRHDEAEHSGAPPPRR